MHVRWLSIPLPRRRRALHGLPVTVSRRVALGGAGVAAVAALSDAVRGTGIAAGAPSHDGESLFNVKDFGGKGDGSTDDTPALQAAIDAAIAAGGGQVLIPTGQFRLTHAITLGDGVDLVGLGSTSVLKPGFPSPLNRVIKNDWINGNKNLSLRNFKLDRSGANVQHGILLNGVDNLLIDGLEVSGTPSERSGCISVSGVGQNLRLISRNVRVVNCVFADTANFGMHLGYVDGGLMANNTALNADREVFGVEPDPGVSATNVVISGNTILGTTSVNGSSTGLIIITTTSGGTVDGVTVTGNVMRQPSPSDTSNPGISVLGATSVTVTGNTVYDMDGPGIMVSDTTGVLIAGNTVNNCARSGGLPGLRLSNANHCSVTGNYVSGAGHTYSVGEDSGAANNLIGANFLRDAVPMGPVGPGTVVLGNKSNDGDSALVIGSAYAMNRRAVSASHNVGPSDYLIAVTDTTTAPSISLPPASPAIAGTVYVVKDESGGAGFNNVTVKGAGSDTIDGAASITIDTNYGAVRLYCTGTGWAVF